MKDNQIIVIEKQKPIKKIEISNQKNDSNYSNFERNPKNAFSAYLTLYSDSFIVPWLVKKVSTAINTGFNSKDEKVLSFMDLIDQDFLNRNLFLLWNCFFEVLRNKKLEITWLIPVLWSEISISQFWDFYIQKNWANKIFFNKFTKKDNILLEINKYESSWAWQYELITSKKWSWYNPNLTEIYHFKNTSLNDKYFGDSDFEWCIDQLVLLELIDSYFENFFDNWVIKNKIIFPKWDKAFWPKDKIVLENFIKSKMKWIKKSFWATVLDREISFLDLEHEIDPEKFLNYRQKLLESIAISLNIPFWVISSVNSNRASSMTDYRVFLQNLVFPLQNRNIIDFKKILAENFWENVDISYKPIETLDPKEKMEILTWFKNSWCYTANEVREYLGKEAKEWWDELESSKKEPLQTNQNQEETDILQKFNKIENEFRENY